MKRHLAGEHTGWNRKLRGDLCLPQHKETGCSCCLHRNEELIWPLPLLDCFLPGCSLGPGTLFSLFYCFIFACASLANYYYLAPFAFFCFLLFLYVCGALENAMDGKGEGA